MTEPIAPTVPPYSTVDFKATRKSTRAHYADNAFRFVTAASACSVLLMMAGLVVVLAYAAMPSIRTFGFRFITSSDWRPNELEQPKLGSDGKVIIEDGEVVTETLPPAFGALPVIYGTVMSSIVALVVAVPMSFGAAIFLVRIATKWIAPVVSFLIEFLAAIPSIAYGIWGVFVLAPWLGGQARFSEPLAFLRAVPYLRWLGPIRAISHITMPAGIEDWLCNSPQSSSSLGVSHWYAAAWGRFFSLFHPFFHWMSISKSVDGHSFARALTGRDLFSGGLILAIMIIPIITAISRDVLKAVPRAQIEGTVALGATWWESSKEMLKFSRSGLFGAVMLGLARAAGETMAVTMVIGNNSQITASIFAPAQTMSSLLANEFSEASSQIHHAALSEVALILLLMSLVFNVVARFLIVGKQSRTAAAH